MQEAKLYSYWEYYANSAEIIYWNDNSLKVLHAGTLNEHNGPDFKFARFELNGIIYQGAVEFHVEINDWYKHKHHFDPAYQDVVLHVVANQPNDKKDVKHNMSNHPIPTFLLPKPKIENSNAFCIASKKLNTYQLKDRLQQLALQKLNLKTRFFNKSLKSNSEHALFYQVFFRILGYPFNKSPFEMLALKVPALIYEEYKNRPNLLLAIYLGNSGFLQGSFKDVFALQLQKQFYNFAAILASSILSRGQWQLSATRPLNHPHFRIAAWIAFLTSINNQSPFNYIYQLLEQRLTYQDAYNTLHKTLLLKTEGYWQKHYALDKQTKQKKINVYLGQDRINELINNLIVPLCISIANRNNHLGFMTYLEEFYLWMPGKCNYGSLFRKRPWLREYQNIWHSCNTGQALLHLDDVYCSRNQCTKCPLEREKQNNLAGYN